MRTFVPNQHFCLHFTLYLLHPRSYMHSTAWQPLNQAMCVMVNHLRVLFWNCNTSHTALAIYFKCKPTWKKREEIKCQLRMKKREKKPQAKKFTSFTQIRRPDFCSNKLSAKWNWKVQPIKAGKITYIQNTFNFDIKSYSTVPHSFQPSQLIELEQPCNINALKQYTEWDSAGWAAVKSGRSSSDI